MKDRFKIKTYFIILLFILIPLVNITYGKIAQMNAQEKNLDNYRKTTADLKVRSVDTQIVSKHWGDISKASIIAQVTQIKDLGGNYIAISTPYDNPDQIKLWADEIHHQGLKVWFRSHWLEWEGDGGHEPSMSEEQYLEKTQQFIESHPSFFKEGDAFTVCVEPEQAYGARNAEMVNWNSYNRFIINQMEMADQAFAEIGLPGKVYTNWISMNGWVINNKLKEETVKKLGMLTVDHYTDQKQKLPPQESADILARDIKEMHEKWNVPILLGEWGYNIEQEVSDFEQKEVVAETLNQLKKMDFLVGINYWSSIGNSSRIINDESGMNFSYRPAALELKKYYTGIKK